jgi:hypothetical protein
VPNIPKLSVPRLRHPGEDALGLGTERAPRLGEDDAAADPRQKLHAELRLELTNLLGEGRLGDEQRPRRRRERAVLGCGKEVSELLQSHRDNLSIVKHTASTAY